VSEVVFFLSTGRCGTQWLTSALQTVYGDIAEVAHEPVGPHYRPKIFLRAPHRLHELRSIPAVAHHLAAIVERSQSKSYIELGWPSFSAIPLLKDLFGQRLRLVHLVRHPVPTALSLVTHNFYQPAVRNDAYVRYAQLEPFDSGVLLKEYQESWSKMSVFEKCLFQWVEINLYAEEIRELFRNIPFLRIKMEDMLAPDSGALRELLEFMKLPFRPQILDFQKRRVDSFNWQTNTSLDWREVYKHVHVLTLAERYGYDLEDVDSDRMWRRYRRSLWARLRGLANSRLRR
jgi:Sulfotransferase domain